MHGAVGKITLPRQKIQENTIAFISGVLTLTLTLHPNPNPDPDPNPDPNPNPNPHLPAQIRVGQATVASNGAARRTWG